MNIYEALKKSRKLSNINEIYHTTLNLYHTTKKICTILLMQYELLTIIEIALQVLELELKLNIFNNC